MRIDERVMIRVAPFGMDLVLSLYSLAAPLLLIELKANPVELGLIGSITSAVHMGLAHRMGPYSDRFGRRRLILIAPLLLASSCLIAVIAGQVKVVLMLSAINGLCLSLFWPPFQAWVAERQTGSGLARDIGTLNLAWTAAYVAGPVISGFLFSVQRKLPFLFAAGMALLLFLLSYGSIHDQGGISREKQPPRHAEIPNRQKHFLYIAWIANFMSWFLLANARYQFPKLARELGTSPQVVGILLGFLGFSLFLGFFYSPGKPALAFSKALPVRSPGSRSGGGPDAFLCRTNLLVRAGPRPDRHFRKRHLLLQPALRDSVFRGKRKGNGLARIHSELWGAARPHDRRGCRLLCRSPRPLLDLLLLSPCRNPRRGTPPPEKKPPEQAGVYLLRLPFASFALFVLFSPLAYFAVDILLLL